MLRLTVIALPEIGLGFPYWSVSVTVNGTHVPGASKVGPVNMSVWGVVALTVTVVPSCVPEGGELTPRYPLVCPHVM